MLYSVNLEQDVCGGSCLLNAQFMTEWSRKADTGGGEWILCTFTQLNTQNSYTDKKFNDLVELVTFSTFMLSDRLVSHFTPW